MEYIAGKRIKELREQKEISQTQLAKEIGFGHAIIGFWESGDRKPAHDALIALAKFFDVTTDYILGLED